ncbi:MAG TPA: hypothetical protein VML19_20575 [Verrucomicrobiae bacterium]|nr:hypothetical protein [Verrucomicrobiae bacterium]
MRVWSIGIYTGASPHCLAPHPDAVNPVLTAAHVTDCPATFVADPFMLQAGGAWYMFFELMAASGIGAIGLASSADALSWRYQRIVLQEPFHLSYPHVFEWGGEYFMTPETLAAGAVRLYRADPFPFRWTPVADLVTGSLADPSLFRHRDRWWLLACGAPYAHDSLRLFESRELGRGWAESAISPLIEGDRRTARPAGRVTEHQGNLIRFAQDCHPYYGAAVRAFAMESFPESLRERELPHPVLDSAGAEWSSAGMHHVDPHRQPDGGWIACVDGAQRIG